MGSASSKAARKLPKGKPTWAGARAPSGVEYESAATASARPLPSETKNKAIEQDAKDPHFLSALNRLGPVAVDHHMQTIRPGNRTQEIVHKSRARSEAEAASSRTVRNRLLAASLSDLLESRKQISSQQELQTLASSYNIDIAKLNKLSEFVNTPSIDDKTIVRSMEKNGEETITTTAKWV